MLNNETQVLRVKASQLEQIKNVENALSQLDNKYFQFDKSNKRYKLAIDATFNRNSSSITDIPLNTRVEIRKAGNELYKTIAKVIQDNPEINYLLVIEGNTQRSNNNWVNSPDVGYKLSYQRALALFNYWKSNGIDFRKFGDQCEVIIAGSGYFSHSRDLNNENNNRRFSIQITSKVGQFLETTSK